MTSIDRMTILNYTIFSCICLNLSGRGEMIGIVILIAIAVVIIIGILWPKQDEVFSLRGFILGIMALVLCFSAGMLTKQGSPSPLTDESISYDNVYIYRASVPSPLEGRHYFVLQMTEFTTDSRDPVQTGTIRFYESAKPPMAEVGEHVVYKNGVLVKWPPEPTPAPDSHK